MDSTQSAARRLTDRETAGRRGSSLSWAGCWCLLLLACSSAPAAADEYIDLVIPLRNGRYYTLRDVCAECNRKLNTTKQLDQIKDREFELTLPVKLALIAAEQAGLIRVKYEPNQFVLSVPNAQDDRVRRQNRRRLGQLLGIAMNDWPPEKGLHLPADFDPAARTVLLIHGLEGGAVELERFRVACRFWGIQPLIFDYPNDGPLAWSGERLAIELKALTAKYPGLRIAIVAHSMGGLVARHALEISLKDSCGVTDVVFLGTPHRGSSLARAQPVLEVVLPLLQGTGLGTEMLCDGLGEAGDDLLPTSDFLKQLAQARRVAGVRYHVAIGTKSFLTEEQRLALERKVQTLFSKVQIAKVLEAEMLEFLRSDELKTGKGDGAVSIVSAHLDGAVSERQFDLNHLELLALPGVVSQDSPLFRWTVETLRCPQGTPRNGK